MIVVYDSNTGVGKRFAESLGYPTQTIKEKLESPVFSLPEMLVLGKFLVYQTLYQETSWAD